MGSLRYCPKCGNASFAPAPKSYACAGCGFTLFLNSAAAVAAIIEYDGSLLACVRACDPAAGKLDLPGGFVDYGETAEQALARELEEELNLKEFVPRYFGTYTNTYTYKAFEYHTLDLVFTVKLDTLPDITPADDVAAVKWIKRQELDLRDFAFSSIKASLSDYTGTA